jgi:hypothetical protein
VLFGGLALVFAFILLIDPYDVVPFSLPLDRRIVSISQRHMYPQIVRSGKFDSLLVGTSTSRLIDPERLNGPFHVKLANLAVDSMTAWEQKTMIEYFLRKVGPPKVLIVALDAVWCLPNSDVRRTTMFGFPDWLYDDNPWNDYLYLLNSPTLEIAFRTAANSLGFYPERIRYDGFGVFTPPEHDFGLDRVRNEIWRAAARNMPADVPPPELSAEELSAQEFPALRWLDDALADMPSQTLKVLAYMPVHVMHQPYPGSRAAAVEVECKRRIAAIAQARGAKVVDWRIASPITTKESNYWDPLHYRLPVAQRLADEIVQAVVEGRESSDGSYRIVVR